MAGLAAAARARELGATPAVFEKGNRAGGSMLLSSCVIWRFREWDDFRAECPLGDERLQRIVWEQLDEAITWLEALGAPVVQHETGNPRTVGKRFDPRGLTEVLVRAAGDVRLGETTRRGRWCSRPEAFREAESWLRSTCGQADRFGCARIPGVREMGCGPVLPEAVSCRPGWTSSTGATCPMRTSPRRSSYRSRSCTAVLRACTTSGARSSSRAKCRGPKTISCRRPPGSRTHAPTTCSTTKRLRIPTLQGGWRLPRPASSRHSFPSPRRAVHVWRCA